jgi:GTP-binding protein HflX
MRVKTKKPDNSQAPEERAILVGLEFPGTAHGVSVDDSLDELRRLTTSAGAVVIRTFTQHPHRIHPATLIGSGKVSEIKEFIQIERPDLAIFDTDLNPAQQRNLESALNVRVIDRSQLILDIFAQRAESREGKLQVELAQLEYLLPRLTRRWSHLSRITGGIGTRGPGETQLEVDRRRIRERIGSLKRRLGVVERTRRLQRQERTEVPYPTVALVGYTNSGKSTLMNYLTSAGVAVEDKLFATLDPRTRCLRLSNRQVVMLVDTVGFINKIPHSLVEAFKSTLEEVREADLLLCLVDSTSPLAETQIHVVESVLDDIGAGEIPRFVVPNKIDVAALPPIHQANGGAAIFPISARTGAGVGDLLGAVEAELNRGKKRVRVSLSPSETGILSFLYARGQVLDETYSDGRIRVTALVSPKVSGQLDKLRRASRAASEQMELGSTD